MTITDSTDPKGFYDMANPTATLRQLANAITASMPKIAETWSLQHSKVLAEILRETVNKSIRQEIAEKIANVFIVHNIQGFEPDRFYLLCGLKEIEPKQQ